MPEHSTKDTHELINDMRLELKGDLERHAADHNKKFDAFSQSMENLNDKMSDIRVQVTENKVRSKIVYGAVAAVFGMGGALFVDWLI